MFSWDSIQLGFERFLELVRRDERVQEEFERSRAEFFATAGAASAPGAELRHLEWFLLERPSPALGAIPAQAWHEEWRASLPDASTGLSASFLQSLPGAFEVTSLVPAEGLWVRDLFTQGEHPVAEARAARAIEVGDLLVGRLFPAGGGTFLLSPAVSVFRNPVLLAAVRNDLGQMRAARRGVLRVQQLELERLFHGQGSDPSVLPAPAELRQRARAELLALGLPPADVDDLLGRVQQAARAADGRVITEILNGLAFETGVDLSSARLVLVELWNQERSTRLPAAAEEGRAEARDVRAALEAFDRGRAEGKDLELLFRELERDLGVDGEDEDEADEQDLGAPDFPGVVGAMVEEFLWEVEREQGAERALGWGLLRELGNYGRDIGVFEELGHARLLDFSARWLLDESGLKSSADVERILEALTAFCQWCEEHHDLPLWKQFGSTLAGLRASVPRHLLLRQHARAGAGQGAYRVVRVVPGRALVRDGAGHEQAVVLTEHQEAHLRDGDLVRLALEDGTPSLGPGYPAELAAFFF